MALHTWNASDFDIWLYDSRVPRAYRLDIYDTELTGKVWGYFWQAHNENYTAIDNEKFSIWSYDAYVTR